MYLILSQGFVSLPAQLYFILIPFLFLCCPAICFIACLALFLFYFFAAQLLISLPAQLYFFSISLLPSY
jgi:hypothetical protein